MQTRYIAYTAEHAARDAQLCTDTEHDPYAEETWQDVPGPKLYLGTFGAGSEAEATEKAAEYAGTDKGNICTLDPHFLLTNPADKSSRWQDTYTEENGSLQRDLGRENDDTPVENIGRYEIVFDYDGRRYYCFVDAVTMEEALGIFFKSHKNLTYNDIWEHMEV